MDLPLLILLAQRNFCVSFYFFLPGSDCPFGQRVPERKAFLYKGELDQCLSHLCIQDLAQSRVSSNMQ